MLKEMPVIVVTCQGRIHTILGPDGPIPYSVVDVESSAPDTSPYRIQTVIPRRAYMVRGSGGMAEQEVSADDIAAVKRFALPGDIQAKDRVLVRAADKTWCKEEYEVVGVVDRFEYVLRNGEGDTCAVVLAHNILAIAPPKSVKKPKKRVDDASPGRRGRPVGTAPSPTMGVAAEPKRVVESQDEQAASPTTSSAAL